MHVKLFVIQGLHVLGLMDTVDGKEGCYCVAVGYASPAIKAEYEAKIEHDKKLNGTA